MDILRKTIIAFLPVLLAGCSEDFDPHIDVTPVLCINSLITAGQPIEVSVSRSWVYSDEKGEEDHSVNDATVRIFANGTQVGHDYLPAEGDAIRIEAYSEAYGSAEAEVTVPFATPIADVDVNPVLNSVFTRDLHRQGLYVAVEFDVAINLTLPNYKDSDRYYYIKEEDFQPEDKEHHDPDESDEMTRWFTTPSGVWFNEGRFYFKDPFFYEHISSFDDVMDNAWVDDPIFFSNRQFEGESETLHLGYEECQLRISQWDHNPEMLEYGYLLTLYSISESYYKWMNYLWQSDNSVMGDLIDMGFAEPMWGYSNVSTGAGIVAAQSSTTVTIDLKEFLLHTLTNAIQ